MNKMLQIFTENEYLILASCILLTFIAVVRHIVRFFYLNNNVIHFVMKQLLLMCECDVLLLALLPLFWSWHFNIFHLPAFNSLLAVLWCRWRVVQCNSPTVLVAPVVKLEKPPSRRHFVGRLNRKDKSKDPNQTTSVGLRNVDCDQFHSSYSKCYQVKPSATEIVLPHLSVLIQNSVLVQV